jgi:hypothetical protein
VRLGRPSSLPAQVVALILEQRRAGLSLPAIARALNDSGTPTAHGGARWHPSAVAAVLKSQQATALAG